MAITEDDGWLVVTGSRPHTWEGYSPAGGGGSKKKVILPPCGRRLRHLNGVLVRRLHHRGVLEEAVYRLHGLPADAGGGNGGGGEEVPEGPLLHESEEISDTVNPVWRELPSTLLTGTPKAEHKATRFLVTVHAGPEREEVSRHTVDLRALRYLGATTEGLQVEPGPNKLLLDMADGVFAPVAAAATPQQQQPPSSTPASTAAPPAAAAAAAPRSAATTPEPDAAAPLAASMPAFPVPPRSALADFECCILRVPASKEDRVEQAAPQTLGDTRCDVTRLLAASNALQAAQESVRELRGTIAATLARKKAQRDLLLEREQRTFRLNALRARVAEAEKALKAKQSRLIKERERVRAETESVRAAMEVIAARRAQGDEVVARVKAMREEDATRAMHIARGKEALVHVLRRIFPIEVNKMSDALTVCGMELGRDRDTFLTDDAATALGYVTHCIQLLACVWNTPLRHTVLPIASRSYIQETYLDGTGRDAASMRTPLFCPRNTASERQRCLQSVMLLNSDLRQLLQVRHLSMLEPKQMLFNLKQLLEANQSDMPLADDGED
eukprot:Rhum_TRINITY_DN14211_c0_g1::Rhum_TRINITY_DN14211_c0_g1_i1::g.73598::m.73598/K21249/UVRAG; UV radiation resistance-associated gene protein